MAIFIGGFAAWSFFAPLAEAAMAQGVISVEGEHRIVANQEGGSVQELLVHDGDHVQAGQVLMRMNDVQASATAETAKAQRWTLLAQLARLDLETAGDSKVKFQPELLAAAGGRGLDATRAVEAMSVQRALFEARTIGLSSQIAVQQDRIDQQTCCHQLSRTTATGDPGAARSYTTRGRGEADVAFEGVVEAE